jgi:superfamily II DNA or RNA helicase
MTSASSNTEQKRIDILIQDAVNKTVYSLNINLYEDDTGKKILTKDLKEALATTLKTLPRYLVILFQMRVPEDDEYLNTREVFSDILKYMYIKRGDWKERKNTVLMRLCRRNEEGLGN